MEQKNSNGIAIAALVCGILGIVLGWVPFGNIVTLVLSIVGIVLGVKGRKTCPSTGMATAGLVCGIVGTCFSALGVLCFSCPACIGICGSMGMM